MTQRRTGRVAAVAMEYHQSRSSALVGDPTWRPDDWTAPEFMEGDGARAARDHVEAWLASWREGVAHATWLMDQMPDARAGALALAHWLDSVLYGDLIVQCPRQERAAIQLAADSMARAHFCCMDFGALAARVREVDIAAQRMA